MRVLLVQSDIVWEDGPANRARLSALLDPVAPLPNDLIVLPEMHNTGFSMNIQKTSSDATDASAFLRNLARQRGAYTIASITVPDSAGGAAGGQPMGRNRALVHSPAGDLICVYDKVHPFSYGAEATHIVGGERIALFDWHAASKPGIPGIPGAAAVPGVPPVPGAPLLRCGPLVCYDLRFPELFRSGLDGGAELFVVVANWPEARAAHWRALLIARAIENQAFVVGVNRTGRDPTLAYAGGSIVIDPRGSVLSELGAGEQVVAVEIDPQEVRRWREKFPAWRDRRWARLEHGRASGGNPPAE